MAYQTKSANAVHEKPVFPPLRACIFDVDGTLINSEDIYTDIYNHVLHSYGKPSLPWDIKAKQQSKGREGQQLMLDWASLPITPEEWGAQCKAQHDRFKSCKLLPGVDRLLRNLSLQAERANSNPEEDSSQTIHLAIASSSSTASFKTKTSHLPIFKECIPHDLCVFGDDPAMSDARKKPNPDIFWIALDRINEARTTASREKGGGEAVALKAEECLVFEDSIAGVEAARRAGMRVVWVPHEGLIEVCRGREGAVMSGMLRWDRVVEEEGLIEKDTKGRLKLENGWAEMLMSLEDFEGASYGINV